MHPSPGGGAGDDGDRTVEWGHEILLVTSKRSTRYGRRNLAPAV